MNFKLIEEIILLTQMIKTISNVKQTLIIDFTRCNIIFEDTKIMLIAARTKKMAIEAAFFKDI